MTGEELNSRMAAAADQLRGLGIPLARILDQEELLQTTLIHELLHTCYGCQNHGKRW